MKIILDDRSYIELKQDKIKNNAKLSKTWIRDSLGRKT